MFPISIDGRKPHWIALAMSIQTVATHLVLYYVRHPNHAEALWFANVANQLLWWTYIKVRKQLPHPMMREGCCSAPTPPVHSRHLSYTGCCTAGTAVEHHPTAIGHVASPVSPADVGACTHQHAVTTAVPADTLNSSIPLTGLH